jgi:sodium-dependent dicarboxylate transporter 2/3/5
MAISMKPSRIGGLVAAALALVLPMIVDVPDLPEPGERVLGIFLMAVVLWVTEAIPLFATAALIIFLEIALISDQAVWSLPGAGEAVGYEAFFATLAHPVLMLFLGGFFLAEGASKFALDRTMARVLLRPFGSKPSSIVLGLMVITAAFSMFMSNTATTATLLAVVLPVVASLDPDDRLRAGMVLAVPIAANVGGIGTPVGTPPNAIAVGSLADAGISVSFVKWMILAVPLMMVLLVAAWRVIVRLFPSQTTYVEVKIEGDFNRSPSAWVLYVVFALTVGLWLTEPLHGINSSVVGFLPVVVLLATGVFGSRELQAMPWHVLWLVAGGIALGIGVTDSGLDQWFIDLVSWEGLAGGVLAAALAATALAMSTIISNSAAANLLVPIGLSLALSDAVDVDPVAAGFFIAIGSSLAMALPVSTPPNAIAYSAGTITTRDLATVGIIVGIIGWILYVFVGPALWNVMGVELA